VPPIVDAETWALAQECLTENKARAARNTQHEYLLRGLVFCPCGRRWCGRYKKHVDRAYYRCPSTDAEYWRNACSTRFSIRQDLLEPSVWQRVVDFLLEPEILLVEIERERSERASESEQRGQRLQASFTAIAGIDRKLAALLDQALEGFPADIIAAKRRQLTEQRDELESERRRLQAEQIEGTITPETEAMLHELAEVVRESVPCMTFAEKRRLLEILRVRVDVLEPGRVRISGIISGSVVNLSSKRS